MPLYSHSRLSTYEKCPLQYRYRYLDKIKRDTDRDYFMSPDAAKEYGIIDAVYSAAGDPLGLHDRPDLPVAVGAGSPEDNGDGAVPSKK